MKTDHIFYRIFKDLPATFFELWEDSPLVKWIYLNELTVDENTPLGVQIIHLIVTNKKQFLETSNKLM